MLDSIRARLRRATDRRRQASHTEQIAGAPNEAFQGLIQPTHELIHTLRPAPELIHTRPQAPELILTRPQTVDLGSLRRGGLDEPQFPAPQLAEADAMRPKTGQGGLKSKAERRRNGGDAEVLILDGRKGGPAERSALEWEAAVEGSPLQISTIPLREALTSPRNRPATTKPAGRGVELSKSGKDTCQSQGGSARQLTDGFASERRAKTSHGSRRKSSETDEVAGSVRKRVQSAHHLNRRGEESGHREGQENRGLNEEVPSPYKGRAESRPSSSQSSAEKTSRKRTGSIRRSSVLAPTLGTPNGLDSSQEKFVVRGRGGLEERKAVRSAKGGVAKEAEKGGGTKRVVKGVTNQAQNGPQETEWRERTPRLAKNLLASAPVQDLPQRSRRKSDGDETPKRKPASLVIKRRSSSDVAPSPSSSGRGEVSDPREPPRSAAPSGKLTEDHQSRSAADVSPTAPADVSKGDARGSVGGGVLALVGGARKSKTGKEDAPDCESADRLGSGAAEGKVSGRPEKMLEVHKSEQRAVLTGRGANRPSTPSPFAIVSKKEDDAARSSGVARNLFRSPSESGNLEADDFGSAEMLEWIQGGGQKTNLERVHKWGGAKVAESGPQSGSKFKESKTSVFLGGDGVENESKIDVGSLETLMSDLRTSEASTLVAIPAGARDDVMLTQNALILGQGAERRLMQECAALMEWLGLTWDVLLKDLLEPPPSPLTKTRATRSPGAITRLSPRGSPKVPPRSPSSSPRLDRRGSPTNRPSTLWIPT